MLSYPDAFILLKINALASKLLFHQQQALSLKDIKQLNVIYVDT